MSNLNTVVFDPTKFVFPSPATASWAISASWAPSTPSSATVSASWASQSLSASWAPTTSTSSVNSLTSSYFYSPSGSGAWRIFVSGSDLVFQYF